LKPKQERRLLEKLYAQIPKMECISGCHDCCGPVYGSREELKKAPLLSETYDSKLDFMIEHGVHCDSCLSCPYVTASGCGIYDDRPLICRLYGATEDSALQCPHGRAPERKLTLLETRQIWREYAKLDLGVANPRSREWVGVIPESMI
jgi:Fe-S-cluster containining protein